MTVGHFPSSFHTFIIPLITCMDMKLFNEITYNTVSSQLSINPASPNLLVLRSDFVLIFVDLKTVSISIVHRYRGCIHTTFMDSGELVVLDREWRTIQGELPPPLYYPRFGT